MLKKIALVLVGLIALLLIYATTRPGEFRVERRIDIKAPPDKIYPLPSGRPGSSSTRP